MIRAGEMVGSGAHRRFVGLKVVLLAATALCGAPASVVNADQVGAGQDWHPALAGRIAPDTLIAQAERSFDFAIPAQPLSAALDAFAKTTGWQVGYPSAVAAGRSSSGVSGAFTPQQALTRLLAGTGLSYRMTGTATVTLEPAAQTGSGAVVLDPVTVEAQRPVESAWGPVDGYVASRTATATKTDTPLIETPQSISVVTRDQMTAQGASSLAEALRYTPGVTGEAFGLDTRGYGVQMRGFTTWDQAFYRDGLQLRAPAFANFLPLDPYGAERLEVLRGPASVLYGQNDPGGIINYVSKRPSAEPLHEIEGAFGSDNRYEGRFDFSGPLDENGKWLYRVTGVGRDSETYVDHVDHDRFFIAPALTWRPSADTSLTLLGHYQRDETGWTLQFLPAAGTVFPNPNGQIPRNRFTGEPDFDKYDLTQYSVGYLFEHRLDETWTLRQNARYAHLGNEQNGVFGLGFVTVNGDPSDPANYRLLDRYGDMGKSELDSYSIDNQAQAKFATGEIGHTLLFGLDFQHHRLTDFGSETSGTIAPIDLFDPVYGTAVNPDSPYQDTDATQMQVGVYAQDQIKFDKFVLTFGGRQDWVDTDTDDRLAGSTSKQNDNSMTGRIGLVYLSDTGLAPYVSYSESFLPALGTDATGRAFAPETGVQYEVGVKYQPPGWNSFVTLAAFDITRQNVLTSDPNDPNFQVQTGEVRSRGVELEGVASLTSSLNLRAAYTVLDMEITEDNDGNQGNTPYGVARHRAALWADYRIRGGVLDGLGFGAGVRYIGSTFGDDANTFKVPDVTLADAALYYELGNYRFAVNASNIFDTEYVASCSGASFCYYGTGRTVLGTVAYRW